MAGLLCAPNAINALLSLLWPSQIRTNYKHFRTLQWNTDTLIFLCPLVSPDDVNPRACSMAQAMTEMLSLLDQSEVRSHASANCICVFPECFQRSEHCTGCCHLMDGHPLAGTRTGLTYSIFLYRCEKGSGRRRWCILPSLQAQCLSRNTKRSACTP